MSVEGVLLTFEYLDDQDDTQTAAASGIKFNKRWVLTHGSFLSSIHEKITPLLKKNKLNSKVFKTLPIITILGEKPTDGNSVYEIVENLSKERELDLEHPSYKIAVATGRICYIWSCSLLKRCVDQLLRPWTVAHKDADIDAQTSLGKELLPVFVLIDLEHHTELEDLTPLAELKKLVVPAPDRGSEVELHSTPFGCELFLNSATKGTVCSALGERSVLQLTDAAASMGCEGAPAFLGGSRSLFGISINNVSWWRGEWVGLGLLAALQPVLGELLGEPLGPPRQLSTTKNTVLAAIDSSTALVRCGAGWGAGLWLGGGGGRGAGCLLTCAHVVKYHKIYTVYVCSAGVKRPAVVRYKTPDDVPYDLALLYTDPGPWGHVTAVEFATRPAEKGEGVAAAGFPFVSELEGAGAPAVSRGHVANCAPSLLQTSCCVQPGFSGGPIIRVEFGRPQVLGVTVSNARASNRTCYPHVNMAVPVGVFRHTLDALLDHNDTSKLETLTSDNEIIKAQWKLIPYKSRL